MKIFSSKEEKHRMKKAFFLLMAVMLFFQTIAPSIALATPATLDESQVYMGEGVHLEAEQEDTESESENELVVEEETLAFDPQPTTVDEVQEWIDSYIESDFDDSERPNWEEDVAENLLPDGWETDFVVGGDEYFEADFYTILQTEETGGEEQYSNHEAEQEAAEEIAEEDATGEPAAETEDSNEEMEEPDGADSSANDEDSVNDEATVQESTPQTAHGYSARQASSVVVNGTEVTIEGLVAGTLQREVANIVSDGSYPAITRPSDITKLTVTGGMKIADLDYIWKGYSQAIYSTGDLPNLTYLDLAGVTLEGNTLPKLQFADHRYLQSISLPNTLVGIGDTAFRNAAKLTSITVPGTLESIEGSAFSGSGLGSIDLSGTQMTSIGDRAFYGAAKLTSITVPSTLVSIGYQAFNGSGLESIDLSGTQMTSIGRYAFYGAAKLTSITVPSTLVSIGEYAFADSGLRSIDLSGTNVTSIGNSAFYGAADLTSIDVPSTLESIGDNAFYKSGLKSIDLSGIPRMVAVGRYTFGETSGVRVLVPPTLLADYQANSNWRNNVNNYGVVFLYAAYTVTFDANGGAWDNGETERSQMVPQDTAATNPSPKPTKAGSVFGGWYTANEGGEKWDFESPVTGDMTLYAHWKEPATSNIWVIEDGKSDKIYFSAFEDAVEFVNGGNPDDVDGTEVTGDDATKYTIYLDEDVTLTSAQTIKNTAGVTVTSDSDTRTIYSKVGERQRHFAVNGTLILQNITLDGSNEGGGVKVNSGGKLEINSEAVIQNCFAANGGGVEVDGNASLIMSGGKIANNEATNFGGGIYVSAEGSSSLDIVISGSTITGNQATSYSGGGIYAYADSSSSVDIGINGSTITGNQATYTGGGIYASADDFSSVEIVISGSTITGNQATYSGGGIYASADDFSSVDIDISGSTITDNTVSNGSGGGIFAFAPVSVADPSSVTIDISDNSIISDNSATNGDGGGIWISDLAKLTTDDSTVFSGNTASRWHDPKAIPPTNIGFANISVSGLMYDTPLNNYDIHNVSGAAIVTFNSNGGSEVSKQTVVVGNLVTEPTAPTKARYVFNGWFEDNETFNDKWDFTTDKVTADITLYAKWGTATNIWVTEDKDTTQARTYFHSFEEAVEFVNGGNPNDADGTQVTGDATTVYTIYLDEDVTLTVEPWFDNTAGVTVRSADVAAIRTIKQTSDAVRHFNVAGSLTLEHIILDGSTDGTKETAIGGGVNVNGELTMNDGAVIQNCLANTGGGVWVEGNNNFIMNGGVISGNSASYGGGVNVFIGTFTMNGGDISDNSADYGGGVYVEDGTFTMEGGEISGNAAIFGNGGGVYMMAGIFTMKDSEISGNTAISDGGGVYVEDGTFTMEGGKISGNTANYVGGGISIWAGTFRMSGSVISSNTASIGGGIYVAKGSVDISGASSIVDNTATNRNVSVGVSGSGGGIFTGYATAYGNLKTSDDTIFSGNRAPAAFTPLEDAKESYPDIKFASTSIAEHPLNNFDINFYGDPFTVKVTYNANGGTGEHIDLDILPGTAHTVLSAAGAGISRAGYTFAGWNTQADGNGTDHAVGAKIVVWGDLTLYAQWTGVYTVTLNYVDMSGKVIAGTSPTTTSVSSGSTFTVTPKDITGYRAQHFTVGTDATERTDFATGVVIDEDTDITIYYASTTISVTIPTDWEFYVDDTSYPEVRSNGYKKSGYYTFTNESELPVIVSLTEKKMVDDSGLTFVTDATSGGPNEISINLELPGGLTDNGFTSGVNGIIPTNPATSLDKELGILKGTAIEHSSATSDSGHLKITGHYNRDNSERVPILKNPTFTLTFTYSLVTQ